MGGKEASRAGNYELIWKVLATYYGAFEEGGWLMLGPALAQLFNELDSRKDRQTSYEKRLYVELLLLKASAEAFPRLTRGRSPKSPEPSDFSSGPGLDSLSGITGAVIGLQDGDDEAPRLQVNCNNENCPNKEFK